MDLYPTSYFLVNLCLALLLAAWLVDRIRLLLTRRRFKALHACQPLTKRVPRKDPFFGLDLLFKQIKAVEGLHVLGDLVDQFNKYGNTLDSIMVGRKIILTAEPQNLKAILSARFKDFGLADRQRYFDQLLGHGIFTTDGESWAHSRQLLRPNFAKTQVADLDALEQHFQAMLRLLPTDNSTVDLQELFFSLTIDTATDFLFGQSVHSLQPGYNLGNGNNFADAFNLAQCDITERFRLGSLYRLTSSEARNRAQRAIETCHSFVDRFVDRALEVRKIKGQGNEKQESKYLFLNELAHATDDKKRLRDELLNVLLAGRDTTASLLSNMFFEIARQPEIWNKLKAEVQSLTGGLPDYEQLRNFKYIRYCINESLRLHPVVPYNYRQALVDTVLPVGGGPEGRDPIFIPKGMFVHYVPYAMHRRTDLFGHDAHIFRPDRWMSLRPSWDYLPFNGGPRICLGQQYALTEATYVTVRLLQEFDKLQSRDNQPWREKLSLTICSYAGVMVGLVPATDQKSPPRFSKS